ncbi:MAG: hypothetical protein WDN31_18880 [Hyphomicrobium sp.]
MPRVSQLKLIFSHSIAAEIPSAIGGIASVGYFTAQGATPGAR